MPVYALATNLHYLVELTGEKRVIAGDYENSKEYTLVMCGTKSDEKKFRSTLKDCAHYGLANHSSVYVPKLVGHRCYRDSWMECDTRCGTLYLPESYSSMFTEVHFQYRRSLDPCLAIMVVASYDNWKYLSTAHTFQPRLLLILPKSVSSTANWRETLLSKCAGLDDKIDYLQYL